MILLNHIKKKSIYTYVKGELINELLCFGNKQSNGDR